MILFPRDELVSMHANTFLISRIPKDTRNLRIIITVITQVLLDLISSRQNVRRHQAITIRVKR